MKKVIILQVIMMLSMSVALAQIDSIQVQLERTDSRYNSADSIQQIDSVATRHTGRDEFGFRLGAGPDRSGEIALTWHKSLERYRLETNIGWASCDKWSYINLSIAFHFKWHITGGLNWYVGPGLNLGWYFGDYHFGLGAGAQIGIEFNFSFPLQFSIDIFPRYNAIGADDAVGLGGSGGLSVRYRF